MISILSTFAFLLLFPAGSVSAQEQKKALPDTSQSLVFDFGIAKKDVSTARIFKIYNNGSTSVRIRSISSTPYCNVPVWSTRPIKPGKFGLIKVTYNGAEKGPFEADLKIIYYNRETLEAENLTEQIKIMGVVKD